MTHFAVHLKLTQNCKPTILQLKKKKDKTLVALVVKNPPANAGDMVDSILGWEDSPGEGNGNPLQYSFLENPTDANGVAKSQT